MLYLYKRIIFGLQTNEKLKDILDLDLREMIIMIPLIIVVIIIGIFPNKSEKKSVKNQHEIGIMPICMISL